MSYSRITSAVDPWYGTQTERLTRARKIAAAFKKLKGADGKAAFGVSAPERSGNAYDIWLSFRAGGHSEDENYRISVRGVGFGSVFVGGHSHAGMQSEIQGIAGKIGLHPKGGSK
jgi:hypothetical protein